MALLVVIFSCAIAYGLCALLIPSFRRAFLAIPDARSSHSEATPQGGGLVVVPVALAIAAVSSLRAPAGPFAAALSAALLALMALGAWDDRVSLNPAFRFLVQIVAAGVALAAIPAGFAAAAPPLPGILVSAVLLVAMVWFVNLTNFMDGLDLMSVSQFAPALAAFYWLLADFGGPAAWLASLCLACAGALLGFALLNRPPARLFLGDSGSLPLGLMAATAAVVGLGVYGPFVALLPFLYYLADATLTLARRVLAGEKFWRAHRDHFYQRATRNGLSTLGVVARTGACNIALGALALAAAGRSLPIQALAFAIGAALVALLLRDLARRRA